MKLKKILVIGMTAFTLFSANISVMAAGCSNWKGIEFGTTYCIKNDGCGFLWLQENNKQVVTYERTCVSNSGQVTYEYMQDCIKLGCC